HPLAGGARLSADPSGLTWPRVLPIQAQSPISSDIANACASASARRGQIPCPVTSFSSWGAGRNFPLVAPALISCFANWFCSRVCKLCSPFCLTQLANESFRRRRAADVAPNDLAHRFLFPAHDLGNDALWHLSDIELRRCGPA